MGEYISYFYIQIMKVIYGGFSKCGTKTLAKAFQIIGLKVCDFPDTYIQNVDLWLEYFSPDITYDRKKEIFYQAYKDFDAFCDNPHYNIDMIKMAKEVFTDIKVVYWERPVENWLVSFKKAMILAQKMQPKDHLFHDGSLEKDNPSVYKMWSLCNLTEPV